MSTCHLIIHDQAALLASLSLVAGSVVENTICAEKEEGKNKGAGGRSLSERNGHDDAVVALSEIESRRRGSGVGPVGCAVGSGPSSFPKENENHSHLLVRC